MAKWHVELFDKVLEGNAMCTLEAEEGTGCGEECPYFNNENVTSLYDTCEDCLIADTKRLRKLLERIPAWGI